MVRSGCCWVLLAALVCHAYAGKHQMSLIPPMLSSDAPSGDSPTYEAFDGRKTTSVTLEAGEGETEVFAYYTFDYKVLVDRYRIRVNGRVASDKRPTSWTLEAQANGGGWIVLDTVASASFTTVYATNISNSTKYAKYRLRITEDGNSADGTLLVTISEVQLIGPRAQLDSKFPDPYTCKNALRSLTGKGGPTTIFSQSRDHTRRSDLRSVFHTQRPGTHTFYFDGSDPVVLGAEFTEATKILQIMLRGADLTQTSQVVLEGSACTGGCDQLGVAGWTQLGVLSTPTAENLWAVPFPGFYKGYRLSIYKGSSASVVVESLFFLGCRGKETQPAS